MPFAEPKPLPADLKSFPDDGKPGQGDGPEYLKKAKPPRGAIPGHTKWRLIMKRPYRQKTQG